MTTQRICGEGAECETICPIKRIGLPCQSLAAFASRYVARRVGEELHEWVDLAGELAL